MMMMKPSPNASHKRRISSLLPNMGGGGGGAEDDLFTSLVSPLLSSSLLMPSFSSSFSEYTKAYPLLWNAVKLFVLTIVLEAARRWFNDLVAAIQSGLAFTVHIPETDPAHQWIHQWLSAATTHELDGVKVPIWLDLLEAIFPTGRVPPRTVIMVSRNPWIPPMDELDNPMDPMLKFPTLWTYPSITLCRVIIYHGHLMQIDNTPHRGLLSRLDDNMTSAKYSGSHNTIRIKTYSRSRKIVAQLVRECRQLYLEKDLGHLTIYHPRNTNSSSGSSTWTRKSSKPGRPWDSIILPEGMKEGLLKDASDFVKDIGYYKKRGMPYRRGLIGAIASKLRLDVYVINMHSKQIDGDKLSELFADCPARSIILMEDIDCAFGSEPVEEEDATLLGVAKQKQAIRIAVAKRAAAGSMGISMSGLLNAIDGVGSSEGRLLFCTTSHIEKINPALKRPGRCDVVVEFKGATRSQAREIFIFVYKPRFDNDDTNSESAIAYDDTNNERYAPSSSSTDDISMTEKSNLNFISQMTELQQLANQFTDRIPEETIAAAAIQGYLMRYREYPELAVENVELWIRNGFEQNPAHDFPSPVTNTGTGVKSEDGFIVEHERTM